MLHFDALTQFSCAHCVAICSFLVPANLLATIQTLVLTGLRRPTVQIRLAMILASSLALAMLLHVFSWFVIGIVQIPTYVLLWLAGTCLGVNIWAVVAPVGLARILETGYRSALSWRPHV
jgi:hypothetical protein